MPISPPRSVVVRLGLAVAVVAVLALPTAIQTLPRPAHLADRVAPNGGDPLFVTWALASEAHALRHHPTRLFDANIFYPRHDAIAWSDNVIVGAPVFGLVEGLVGGRRLLAYNVVTFLGFLGVGLATYALALEMLGDRGAALVAATVLSLSMARSISVGHTQLAGFLFVPLALLALIRFLDRRRWSWAVGFGAAAAATWLTTAYYAILLVLVVVPFLATWLVGQHRRQRGVGPRFWSGMAIAGAVTIVLTGPSLVPYLRLQRSGQFARTVADQHGIRLADFTRLPPSLGYRALISVSPLARYDRGGLFPGLVLSALAVVAVAAAVAATRGGVVAARGEATSLTRRDLIPPMAAGAVLPVVVMGGVGANRAVSIPFRVVRAVLPGVASLRDLDRFWIFPLLCLALVAGAGAAVVLRAAGRHRPLVLVGLLALAWVELVFRPPFVTVDLSARAAVADHALRAMPPGPVLELPEPLGPRFPFVNAARELNSLVDGNPRVDGYSGNVPPEIQAVEALASRLAPDQLVGPLRAYGVRYLILHGTAKPCAAGYGPAEIVDLSARLAATAGVTAVSRAGSDVIVSLAPAPVFRPVPSVAPGAPRPDRCS